MEKSLINYDILIDLVPISMHKPIGEKQNGQNHGSLQVFLYRETYIQINTIYKSRFLINIFGYYTYFTK
jgi:hypothetical protein